MARHPTRKDRRRKKRGGKAVDSHCQNHGRCPVCTGNRLYQQIKEKMKAEVEE